MQLNQWIGSLRKQEKRKKRCVSQRVINLYVVNRGTLRPVLYRSRRDQLCQLRLSRPLHPG